MAVVVPLSVAQVVVVESVIAVVVLTGAGLIWPVFDGPSCSGRAERVVEFLSPSLWGKPGRIMFD